MRANLCSTMVLINVLHVFIFFRLVEPSGDAHSTKDARSFMQGVVMKITDVVAKAKVLLIGSNISF